jgi:hypothetical protein
MTILASSAGCRDVFGLDEPLHIDAAVPARVDFAAADSTHDEAAATFSLQVLLSKPADEPITVPVNVAPGASATEGSDFTLASPDVTFAPGEVIQAIDVTILPDVDQTESDEVFQLALGVPAGFAELGDVIVHTVTIRQPRAGFAAAQTNPSVAEGDGGSKTVDLDVVLDQPAAQRATVDLVASGPADNIDFYLVTNRLVFSLGATHATASVRVRGDSTVEPDEAIVLTLTNPINAVLSPVAADQTRTLTIINDD